MALTPYTLAFAADHAGYLLKQDLISYAQGMGHTILDCGTHGPDAVDYPDIVPSVVEAVRSGSADYGVLLCGSGIGVSIAANRHPAIRAALCHCGLAAELARRHDDANILCLGARFIGAEVAKECLHRFLAAPFEEGRHARRVAKLG